MTVADPGFPRRGAPTPEFGPKAYHLARFFAGKCMKMNEIGPERGGASLAHPRSANACTRN